MQSASLTVNVMLALTEHSSLTVFNFLNGLEVQNLAKTKKNI